MTLRQNKFSLLWPAIAALLIFVQTNAAQERCLTPEAVQTMLAQVNSVGQDKLNNKLRNELLKLAEKTQERESSDIRDNRMERMRARRSENARRLCEIIRQHGWPGTSLVGPEGVAAAFSLLRDSAPAQMKSELLPVMIAVAQQGQISKPDFASFVDRMRLDVGLKQLFGTQSTISDGFLVMFPIENEESVDARRKQFQLPPLVDQIRILQIKYQLPLVKATGVLANQFSDSARAAIAQATAANFVEGQPIAEDEVVRIETNLVSLNVSVFSNKLRTHVDTLTQQDFLVTEDGHPETISYFAATDVPFDLVLLIDLSGSTAGKRRLIRKSTQRFIEATRSKDRLAIVTFSGDAEVISPLTDNRAELMRSLERINDERGPSHVWDALNFTLKEVMTRSESGRRRAVVFMTDGVDNALLGINAGSRISFADLLETIRHSDTLIVPIYLDTESEEIYFNHSVYESARKTLALMADESGGLYYRAKRLEDLDGVYRQVSQDLGKVYSLGYKPTNENRDGKWRTVKIELANLPDLKTRARPGYFAGTKRRR